MARSAFLYVDGCVFYFQSWKKRLELAGQSGWRSSPCLAGIVIYRCQSQVLSQRARQHGLVLPCLVIWICSCISRYAPIPSPGAEAQLAQPEPISVQTLSRGIHLRGYRMDDQSADGIRASSLCELSTQAEDFIGLGYSIHLVDQVSGESVASRNDAWADRVITVSGFLSVHGIYTSLTEQSIEADYSAASSGEPRALGRLDNCGAWNAAKDFVYRAK